MKHIIIYENFDTQIFEESTSLSTGAILVDSSKLKTISPGILYITFYKEDKGEKAAIISYLKRDGNKRISLYFTDLGDLSISLKDGKEIKGAKIYSTVSDMGSDQSKDYGYVASAWTSVNEENCKQALDSFLSLCGTYGNVESGKDFAKGLVLTIIEIVKTNGDKSPAPLKSMSAAIISAAKLKKDVIPTTTEEQKKINKVIVDTVSKETK